MFPRPASEERGEPAKRVAPWSFDMHDLGAKFGQLCADERLRDENARADRANAFEWTEAGDHRRRGGAPQALDPFGKGLSEFLDLIFIFDNPRIVRHCPLPPSFAHAVEAGVRRIDSEPVTTFARSLHSGKPVPLGEGDWSPPRPGSAD